MVISNIPLISAMFMQRSLKNGSARMMRPYSEGNFNNLILSDCENTPVHPKKSRSTKYTPPHIGRNPGLFSSGSCYKFFQNLKKIPPLFNGFIMPRDRKARLICYLYEVTIMTVAI